MLSFLAVWIGLIDLLMSAAVALGWLDGGWLIPALYGVPLGITLAVMSLWANRREPGDSPGVKAQRVQSLVAIGLCLAAGALCYLAVLVLDIFEQ
jgi:hypothetical protein